MKIIKKQTNSSMCLICGINNQAGLKAPFYEMEDRTVVSIFEYQDIHQSYPGRSHGGMITSMLDEIVGRAIWIDEPNVWGVTMEINVKFRKPVPLNTKLKAIGLITRNTSRFFEGQGRIESLTGQVLAEAKVKYYKLPIDKISEDTSHDEINIMVEDGLLEIN